DPGAAAGAADRDGDAADDTGRGRGRVPRRAGRRPAGGGVGRAAGAAARAVRLPRRAGPAHGRRGGGGHVKAWQVTRLGAPADVLELVDVPDPVPGPGELLGRVDACAVNFPDVLLCAGLYQEKPSLPFTPGLEVAGTVLSGDPGLV